MVKLCESFIDEIDKMPQSIKSWDVSQNLKNEIDLFKQNMPIVKLLRDHCMRDRHWSNIKILVKDQLDSNTKLPKL